jgi:hypothetical protein
MQASFDDRWMTPTDAYTLCKTVFGFTATRDHVVKRMKPYAVEWGSPYRGPNKHDPAFRSAKRVLFGEYLATARIVAEEARIAEEAKQASRTAAEARQGGGRNERLESLERRIEALEAAFDSLLGSMKEVA